MKQHPSLFDRRQHMLQGDFEAFYYSDTDLRHVEPHRHNFYELLFFAEGDVTYVAEGQRYPLLPGDVLFIPRDTLHYPTFGAPSRYRRVVLWVTEEFVRSLQEGDALAQCFDDFDAGLNQVRFFRFPPEEAGRLLECAMDIAEESSYERPFRATMSSLLVTRLFILMYRLMPAAMDQRQTDSASQQLVNQVVDYINANLDRDLPLDQLADRFFLSKFYLSRIFKKHMNVSPHSYISQRRLFLAKQLLYQGLSPSEVYKRCGYRDYSCFYRAFKEQYGFSPKQLCLQNE